MSISYTTNTSVTTGLNVVLVCNCCYNDKKVPFKWLDYNAIYFDSVNRCKKCDKYVCDDCSRIWCCKKCDPNK